MNEKEAREIVRPGRLIPIDETDLHKPISEFAYAKGYLEAIEKDNGLEKAFNLIYDNLQPDDEGQDQAYQRAFRLYEMWKNNK